MLQQWSAHGNQRGEQLCEQVCCSSLSSSMLTAVSHLEFIEGRRVACDAVRHPLALQDGRHALQQTDRQGGVPKGPPLVAASSMCSCTGPTLASCQAEHLIRAMRRPAVRLMSDGRHAPGMQLGCARQKSRFQGCRGFRGAGGSGVYRGLRGARRPGHRAWL